MGKITLTTLSGLSGFSYKFAPCKEIQDSLGLWILDSRHLIPVFLRETWILDSNR